MKNKEHISKLVEDTINSMDNAERAVPPPFLLTRINARLNETKESFWEKAVWFISRPAVAIPGLAMFILVNLSVVIFNKADRSATAKEQLIQYQTDDFSYAVATIYDIENTEP
ncbi:MAG: hypothetical protein ABIQ31_03105 [Ferruginibacter sp.]